MLTTFYSTHIAGFLPHLFAAVLISVIGITIAYIIRRFLRHGVLNKSNEILAVFLTNLTFCGVLIVTSIMAIGQLGVPTATLITLLGAGSLAVGLALKDFLGNIAAGFMLIFLRPFKIGDYIIANGNAGTVININLFMTQLKSISNECVFVPNGIIVVNPIINQSFYKIRRLDVQIGVGYESDLQHVKTVLQSLLADANFVVNAEPIIIGVTELADSSITLLIRFWVLTENYTVARLQLLELIKQKFATENISLPFPQLDLHIKNESGTNS